MQITINIPDTTPIERVQKVIEEMAYRFQVKIEIVNPEKTEKDLQIKLARWQALMKKTQGLPQVKEISDMDIEAEIEAYRSGL